MNYDVCGFRIILRSFSVKNCLFEFECEFVVMTKRSTQVFS
jgi:hypothetical protein